MGIKLPAGSQELWKGHRDRIGEVPILKAALASSVYAIAGERAFAERLLSGVSGGAREPLFPGDRLVRFDKGPGDAKLAWKGVRAVGAVPRSPEGISEVRRVLRPPWL